MTSYEDWTSKIRSLERPAASERTVSWDSTSTRLGVGVSSSGQVELFISGPQLTLHVGAVADRFAFEHLTSTQFGEVAVNVLTLPPGPEFAPAAAWICAELQRADVDDEPQKAIDRTESVIALILDGLAESAEDFIGLLGEVHLLSALVEASPAPSRKSVVAGWQGHSPSLRDLSLGSTGIEVKTTRTSDPRHHFSGVHQVEPTTEETSLAIVSIGLDMDDETSGSPSHSLDLDLLRIDRALREFYADGEVRHMMDSLRVHIDNYGVASSTNLAADSLERRLLRDVRFRVRWVRSYDASSPSLDLPTFQTLSEVSSLLDVSSVSFTLHFPTDPSTAGLRAGMRAVAADCLRSAGLATEPYNPRHG